MHWRATAFEGHRWMESDYGSAGKSVLSQLTSSSGDDE
jgi:hypothetical protein